MHCFNTDWWLGIPETEQDQLVPTALKISLFHIVTIFLRGLIDILHIYGGIINGEKRSNDNKQ
jgi:hypothetical protein